MFGPREKLYLRSSLLYHILQWSPLCCRKPLVGCSICNRSFKEEWPFCCFYRWFLCSCYLFLFSTLAIATSMWKPNGFRMFNNLVSFLIINLFSCFVVQRSFRGIHLLLRPIFSTSTLSSFKTCNIVSRKKTDFLDNFHVSVEHSDEPTEHQPVPQGIHHQGCVGNPYHLNKKPYMRSSFKCWDPL